MRPLAVLFACAAAALAFAGCDRDGSNGRALEPVSVSSVLPTSAPEAPPRAEPSASRHEFGAVRRIETGEAIWWPRGRNTLPELLAFSDAVVIGRVVLAEDVSDATRFPLVPGEAVNEPGNGEREPAEPNRPQPTIQPYDPTKDPITASRYTLELLEVVWSRAGLVQPVQIIQGGGMRGDIVYELHGDPVIELGQSYLVALRAWHGTPYYTSMPWGRFVVDDGILRMADPDTWGHLPIAELAGRPVDEVIDEVRTAAEGIPSERWIRATGPIPPP